MAFFRRNGAEHRELTAGAFVVSARRGHARGLLLAFGGLVAAVMLAGAAFHFADRLVPDALAATKGRDNQELREALDKTRFDLEVELATRGELERQLVALTERLRQAEEELAFLKAAGSRRPRN